MLEISSSEALVSSSEAASSDAFCASVWLAELISVAAAVNCSEPVESLPVTLF
jgi:hypothetical protein